MLKIPEFFKKYPAKADESLYEHTEALLTSLEKLKSLHHIPYSDLVEYACIYHDIGKMNPHFTERLKNNLSFDEKKEIGHNILSFYLFSYLKEVPNLESADFNIVAYSILNHHFYVDNFELLNDENKRKLIEQNLSLILQGNDGEHFKIRKLRRKLSEIQHLNDTVVDKLVLVKGFLHKCDYSASSHSEIEHGPYDLSARLEGLNYTWNDMQVFAERHSTENLILIGSTGYGKTEASLKWIGNHKGFYVLPLRTALNSMYERLKSGLFEDSYTDKLALLHGDAGSVYLSQLSDERKGAVEPEEENKIWNYLDVSRTMSLPLTLTTPDQLFKFVFKYPGYEMPLASYSYSKIVIDEIQAYNSRILAFLIYGIQRILSLGGKVAVITATLAPFIRDLLQKNGMEGPQEQERKFDFVEGRFLNPEVRHRISLSDEKIAVTDIVNFYRGNQNRESLKILVVLNTIKEAQEMYQQLSQELYGEIEVKLIHARYIVKDRALKEQEILEDGGYEMKKEVIWISTQIVEASLDIDFDFLFTEYTELNSLFQRLGRVNRAGLKSLKIPNSYIFLKIKEEYLSRDFIDETLHNLGKEALKNWMRSKSQDGRLCEQDKLRLINIAYTSENMKDSDYMKTFKTYYDEIVSLKPNSLSKKEVENLFRDIFSVKVIPKQVYERNIEKIEELNQTVSERRLEQRNINRIIRDSKKEEHESDFIKEQIARKREIQFELLEIMNKFRQFTVNVGYFKGIHQSEKKILCGEEILIPEGRYDYEFGFDPSYVEEGEGIFV